MARLLVVVLLLGCTPPQNEKLELAALFPGARTESIVSGSDGSEPAFHQGQEWRFFLHRRLGLRLTLQLEAARAGNLVPVLNGVPLPAQSVRPEEGVLDLEVSEDGLLPGWNVLVLQGDQGGRCRALLVAPLKAALSSRTGEVVRPSVEGSDLMLPFGQTVSFPLAPQGASHLSFLIEPWLDEGVAPLGKDSWTLTVSTRQDDPETLVESRLSQAGPQSLTLAACTGAGMLELSANPNGRHAPLPGQLGLRLVRPTLELEGPPLSSSSTPPALSVDKDGIRLRNLKLVARPPGLYDLAKDPEGKQNLIAERPATALHLESLWLSLQGRGSAAGRHDETLRNLRTLEYLR